MAPQGRALGLRTESVQENAGRPVALRARSSVKYCWFAARVIAVRQQAALRAARGYRFVAGTRLGEPVAVAVRVTLEFTFTL